MCHIFFIHSSVDGDLHCFHVLAMVNSAAVKIGVHTCSVMSDSLQAHRLLPIRFLCPSDYPDKNTRIGCHFLLQGIFSTQGSNLHLLHWQEYCTTESPNRFSNTKSVSLFLGVYLMALHFSYNYCWIFVSLFITKIVFLFYLSDFSIRIYHLCLKFIRASVELTAALVGKNYYPVNWSGCSELFFEIIVWELFPVVSLIIGH